MRPGKRTRAKKAVQPNDLTNEVKKIKNSVKQKTCIYSKY